MSTVQEGATVDTDKLMQFVFRAVEEVGATLNTALVVLGDKLGLYRALAGSGGLTSTELAEKTVFALFFCPSPITIHYNSNVTGQTINMYIIL